MRSSAIPKISAVVRTGFLLIRLVQLLPHGRLRGLVVRPPRWRSPWKLPSDLDVCKEEPACLQMAWTARCTGPLTIGVRRADLEYHTRACMTVNLVFKGPMK